MMFYKKNPNSNLYNAKGYYLTTGTYLGNGCCRCVSVNCNKCLIRTPPPLPPAPTPTPTL